MEEAFFHTHAYLLEHTNATVRRNLMDEIDWNERMIGIKGTRGVVAYLDIHGGFRPLCRREFQRVEHGDRKSTRLNSSHTDISRMPSSA